MPVIGAGPNDSVWIIGCTPGGSFNENIYAWSSNLGTWQQVSGSAATISVGADGTPWAINGTTHSIYEYVSSWEHVGPNGFTFYDTSKGVNRTWSGEIHDIAVPNGGGFVVAGATAGGVWESVLGWFPIADVGAGVTPAGQAPPAGPTMSIGSVELKPSDANTLVVGTGVDGQLNDGTNQIGNGIWYTHNAEASQPSWTEALCNGGRCPSPVVRVRYSADSSKLYAAVGASSIQGTPAKLFIGTESNGTISLSAAGSSCLPSPGDTFTDLVVDPNNASTLYLGVSHEGLYLSTDAGTTCVHYGQLPLLSGNASSITTIALAITSSNPAFLYASVAGNTNPSGTDFQGIFGTTAYLLPNWDVVVSGGDYNTLNSQGQHDWALATDPSGATILAGGVSVTRYTGCQPSGCAGSAQLDVGHADQHTIYWAPTGIVYVANDGGVFTSQDQGVTWQESINTLGVANEVSVAVAPNHIFASAWDMGGYYSLDSGSSWSSVTAIEGGDGHQFLVDPSNTSLAYHCMSITAGPNSAQRYRFDGTSWVEVDSAPVGSNGNPCNLAKGYYSSLFTIYQNTIFRSFSNGDNGTWLSYLTSFSPASPPWAISVSNEVYPTVYVTLSGAPTLQVSPNGGAWQTATTPTGWPVGYAVAGGGGVQGGAAMELDPVTSDLYIVGEGGATNPPAVVYKSPVASHGTSWNQLTGIDGLKLNPNEIVNTIAVDPGSHAVVVGTEGRAQAGLLRLNNPDVSDSGSTSHHWRPWVQGLPNTHQPVKWIAGQYETGVYYYYLASWGRGIWKREARGGDF